MIQHRYQVVGEVPSKVRSNDVGQSIQCDSDVFGLGAEVLGP